MGLYGIIGKDSNKHVDSRQSPSLTIMHCGSMVGCGLRTTEVSTIEVGTSVASVITNTVKEITKQEYLFFFVIVLTQIKQKT